MAATLFACNALAMPVGELRHISPKDKKIHILRVELAITAEDQRTGLMFRDSVKPYDGMWFDFGSTMPISMWMQNTKIPLDMVFVDESGKVAELYLGATPYSESLITPNQPVRYVLELPAGDAKRYGIRSGDTIKPVAEKP